jgi:tetratricopeptide (TPR) repeat protein
MTQNGKFLAALLLGILALPGSSDSATSQRGETSLSGTYLAGRSAGRQRDVEEAADYLTSALELDPANPQIVERLFQFRLAEGAMADAENLAEKVIEFNSQQRMARVVLGLKDMRAGQFDGARQNFAEAAYTPVGELTSALLSAWSYAGEGNLAPALKELDKLSANESFANFRQFHEALIADMLNSKLRAEAAYKKAFEQAGGNMRIVQAYAGYLMRNGKAEQARKLMQTWLKDNGKNVVISRQLDDVIAGKPVVPFVSSAVAGAGEALFSIAAAMNDEESADVALLYARLASVTGTDKPVIQTLLGDIYGGMDRLQLSNDMYEQVAPDSPLRPGAEIQIALNLQRMDKSADAQARLKALSAKDAGDVTVWSTLGNIFRNNSDYKNAVPAYDQAITIAARSGKTDWQLFYFRAIAFERLKQWPQAEADFKEALKLAPEESAILNYYGYSLIDRREQLPTAMEMVKKAVELKPNDGYIVDSLGWAYYQLADYEESLTHMERAVDLRPGDPTIADHLGDVYWRIGRKLEARFQWQHAKDNGPEPEDLKRIEQKLKEGLTDAPPVKPAENELPKENKG